MLNWARNSWDEVTARLATAPADHLPVQLVEAPPDRSLSFPTLSERMTTAMRTRQADARPWRAASINEALGIPAFLDAVTLISNMLGIFTLEGYQNGKKVANEDRPRLIVRPNPFTTARDFFREVGWSMATRGENWMWIAARDPANLPLSVIPVPSREVKASGDWLKPKIEWRKVDKTSDFTAVFLTKELGELRGKGPLQYCGAAISAGVESQEWAANFFATGGHPPIVMHSEDELSETEAQDLQVAWTKTPPNMPQVTSGPMTVEEVGTNEGSAQMLEARMWNAGEASRMWQIPGALLEYGRTGSSLTYQNVVSLMDQLLKQCLIPNYLEPIEQAMTDLLPRTWATRFNVDAVLRADMKTRYEVYKLGFDAGLPWVGEMAAEAEGIEAGSVENAPVPFAPPAAFPSSTPPRTFGGEWRCDQCHRKLAEVRGEGTQMRCRCGHLAAA